MKQIFWRDAQSIGSGTFLCGYCGNQIASNAGWVGTESPSDYVPIAYIFLCHFCRRPTFFDPDGRQVPGAAFGNAIENIPDQPLEQLYNEARASMAVSSYTPVVLACRKILMHIAVAKGAKEGQNFTDYVQYLTDQHYIPPDANNWVDHIRTKGNEANHEIEIMTKSDAATLLTFIEMLLKIIFEFPAAIGKKKGKAKS